MRKFFWGLLSLSIATAAWASRPNWWKARRVQTNSALGQSSTNNWKTPVILHTFNAGDYPACPILWSPSTYVDWTNTSVIMGGSDFIVGYQESSPEHRTGSNTVPGGGFIDSCPSAFPDTGSIYATDAALFNLISYSPDLGTVQWTFPLDNSNNLPGSPTTYGPNAIVLSGAQLVSVTAPLMGTTGALNWRFQLGDQMAGNGRNNQTSPAITFEVNEGVVVATQGGRVYKVNADTGAELWQFDTGHAMTEQPALGYDNTVYAVTADGFLFALDPTTGNEKWVYNTGSNNALTAPALINANGFDSIYFGGFSPAKIYEVSGQDGHLIGSIGLNAAPSTAPVVSSNFKVYIGYDSYPTGKIGLWWHGQILPKTIGGTVRNLLQSETGAIIGLTDQVLFRID